MALPILADVDKEIIRLVLDSISKSEVMQAFFLNTALRKAAQAQDFIDSVNAKNNLPQNASDDDYEKAERAQMAAFVGFASITN